MKLFLFFIILCSDVSARGGGGRGGGGGGRGGGGARAGVGRGGGGMGRSFSRGSSVYSGGSRSGATGWKVGSSSGNGYGTTTFRSTIFAPSYTHSTLTSALVISSLTRPMVYDNRQYYWSDSYAKDVMSPQQYPTICEYQIGPDDGELQNVTFSNGTSAKSLYFGCTGDMERCCGIYCCHAISKYIVMALTLVFILLFVCFCICQDSEKSNRQGARQYFMDKNRTNLQSNSQAIPMVNVSTATSSVANQKS